MSERNLNFEQGVDRKGTRCLKYDFAVQRGRSADILPLWVADMDFKTSSYIQDALLRQAEHGVYGYTEADETYFDAVRSWMERRHGWKIEPEWLLKTPGVVFALAMAVKAYTEPGDYVLIQEPVYYPFREVIESNDREVANNVLYQDENGSYKINFEDFERQIVEKRIRLFILCSPHNPVSRVWTREELEKLGDICKKHGVIVVSDEIHADFIKKGKEFVSTLKIRTELKERLIVCNSITKTFNVPGVILSNMIIPDTRIREKVKETIDRWGLHNPNIFAAGIMEAAYTECDDWLEQVNIYLEGNYNFLDKYLQKHMPELEVIPSEGTYMAWIKTSKLGISPKALEQFFIEKAKVSVYMGDRYGKHTEEFIRVNIATSRDYLEKALHRVKVHYDESVQGR